MPQLTPDPWFSIFMSSWLILLIMIKKTLAHTNLNNFNPKNIKTTPSTWNWPW
uniref:ATP synthase complex subunit 8 n=1 Tax=Dyscophus insularis TaxID=303964 RepID=A0A343VT88_9NEOB|nr:ATP synthase subunit 8 [Dyscophus insularis]